MHTVDPKSLKLVRISTRARQVSTEDEAPSKKRSARKRLGHPPKKLRRKAAPKNKTTYLAGRKGQEPKGDQLPEKSDKGLSEFSDSEASNSVKSSKARKHYPFRVLDQTWKEIAPGHPFLGLSQPSIHENTLPTLCSRGLSDVKVVPTADRQGFVNTEGYWRLLISGLNRRAAISAIFIPQSPDRREGDSEEPTDGVFLSALATGAFTNWYPLETLLNRASEELKGRRSVFVLDVYSHGQDKAEVIINRAY